MKVDTSTWEKWTGWVEKIHSDLGNVVTDQTIFAGFREVIEANGAWIDSIEGGLFIDFIRRNYAAAAFMGIRRQLKASDDSVSLMRLLNQVSAGADQITYDFYLSVFPKRAEGLEWQRWTFDTLSSDHERVSPEIVQADIAEIRSLNNTIEEIADRSVAHLDRRGTASVVSFRDLRLSIEHFNQLACKYIAFFTSDGWTSLAPSFVFNWQEIFRHPWIKPG